MVRRAHARRRGLLTASGLGGATKAHSSRLHLRFIPLRPASHRWTERADASGPGLRVSWRSGHCSPPRRLERSSWISSRRSHSPARRARRSDHVHLRRELANRGHRFRTRSDAEVIPHLCEERGPDFVDALDGMFAVAVWDTRLRHLVRPPRREVATNTADPAVIRRDPDAPRAIARRRRPIAGTAPAVAGSSRLLPPWPAGCLLSLAPGERTSPPAGHSPRQRRVWRHFWLTKLVWALYAPRQPGDRGRPCVRLRGVRRPFPA
jgi:hypothetical protein